MMAQKPKIVLFLADSKIYPSGINAGGGESASVALARSLAMLGEEVIVCANLPDGEFSEKGIAWWNFGPNYSIAELASRLESIGQFHCLSATFVHPFMVLAKHRNCLSRIIINHSPSVYINGLAPQTVLNCIDLMVCVSDAQKKLYLEHTDEERKLRVIRNGFDPELFTYQGPEGRDFSQIVVIGRVEHWKGSHLLFDFFPTLKKVVPDAKLTFIGDFSKFPGLADKRDRVELENPGLKFLGQVPQSDIARHLRTAGLLLFPSIVFESAGLVVMDAQASGCPVVGYATGGVPEYLIDRQCGMLVDNQNHHAFYTTVIDLMKDRSRLQTFSRNCESLARKRTWKVVASELLELLGTTTQVEAPSTVPYGPPYQRSSDFRNVSVEQVILDHHAIGNSNIPVDSELEAASSREPLNARYHLWRGLRYEARDAKVQALMAFERAADCSTGDDWQAHFRLVLLYSDMQNLEKAAGHAKRILQISPDFPLKEKLQEIVKLTEHQGER